MIQTLLLGKAAFRMASPGTRTLADSRVVQVTMEVELQFQAMCRVAGSPVIVTNDWLDPQSQTAFIVSSPSEVTS